MSAPQTTESSAQLKQLAPLLIAAGAGYQQDGQVSQLLEVKDSALISKGWSGRAFTGEAELVAGDNIRPGSSAAYLILPPSRYVIAISASSTLRGIKYDAEEEEWVDDENFPSIPVHPQGHLSTYLDPEGSAVTFFQDPSGKLAYLDGSFKPTVINAANPVVGSPLYVAPAEGDHVSVYYVSADHSIHYVTKASGSWSDLALAPATLKAVPKNISIVSVADTGKLQALALTPDNEVTCINEGGSEAEALGKVEADGNFVPKVSTECGYTCYPCWPCPPRCPPRCPPWCW